MRRSEGRGGRQKKGGAECGEEDYKRRQLRENVTELKHKYVRGGAKLLERN
jgi:hypothetical protein